VPARIARVRPKGFLGQAEGFMAEPIGVDHTVSPEQSATETLLRLIEQPEALQVLDFAEGKLRLIAVRV
jgi:trk/ktr system potassium uptake protein